jgi:pimeloyl-ACP methyl ester carboxylesterase
MNAAECDDRLHSAVTAATGAAAAGLAALAGRPQPKFHDGAVRCEPPVGAPPLRGMLAEALGAADLARLLRAAPWLASAPRGDGSVVIDLPGWRAPEVSTAPLRMYLRLLGWSARPWGLGVNRGTPEADAERLAARVSAASEPVALVGWSLGGVVAREVARALPDRVSRVVTFGTPVVGGPTHTIGARTFGERECRRATALIDALDAEQPIQVPITAIFTRRDRIVDWRACIDRASPNVTHVEVGSTHLSLGIDPDVWWTIATALASTAGNARGESAARTAA